MLVTTLGWERFKQKAEVEQQEGFHSLSLPPLLFEEDQIMFSAMRALKSQELGDLQCIAKQLEWHHRRGLNAAKRKRGIDYLENSFLLVELSSRYRRRVG
ncbi:hypothetical protein KI688_007651 [Linnemannia hyalina]|uniref:Uncharacterized protein n=1 Tax=Linnemannia hyalina TaxID=64524 RepID=A0A9P7XHM1_9FUNG|nr:hypothetical protein KI688_007651 [Linnemannia hyalina]